MAVSYSFFLKTEWYVYIFPYFIFFIEDPILLYLEQQKCWQIYVFSISNAWNPEYSTYYVHFVSNLFTTYTPEYTGKQNLFHP